MKVLHEAGRVSSVGFLVVSQEFELMLFVLTATHHLAIFSMSVD